MEFLEDCACTNKVIAQYYDGAAVMASGLNGVQAKIKGKIPQALFVHCYETVMELHHLTCLVLTIPLSRNSTGHDCLGALALMSIEKGLLLELKSKDKLYDAAIAYFTKTDESISF